MSETARRVCVGVVTGPHGVRGAVRIKSFTETPEDVARYGPLGDESGVRHFELRVIGAGKGVVLARLSGVDDRNQAVALRGQRLYLPRSALPQPEAEEYYHADLIGLEAVLGDGTPVGRVNGTMAGGAPGRSSSSVSPAPKSWMARTRPTGVPSPSTASSPIRSA